MIQGYALQFLTLGLAESEPIFFLADLITYRDSDCDGVLGNAREGGAALSCPILTAHFCNRFDLPLGKESKIKPSIHIMRALLHFFLERLRNHAFNIRYCASAINSHGPGAQPYELNPSRHLLLTYCLERVNGPRNTETLKDITFRKPNIILVPTLCSLTPLVRASKAQP